MNEDINTLDLTGETVMLKPNIVSDSPGIRKFLCESGFGCKPFTSGQAIFGTLYMANGGSVPQVRISRGDILCLEGASPEEVYTRTVQIMFQNLSPCIYDELTAFSERYKLNLEYKDKNEIVQNVEEAMETFMGNVMPKTAAT